MQNYEKLKTHVIEYLNSHACVDCKETDIIVLDFDHVRGKKRYHVAEMIRRNVSLEVLKIEIDKCEIRCANCHRKKTTKQLGWRSRILGGI